MTPIVNVRCTRPNSRHAALLRRAARAAAEIGGAAAAELTVVLTSEAGIRKLNEHYAGLSRPTDVLSFAGAGPDPQTGVRYLGDVVISLPAARVQARRGGHRLADELMLLCVHGVLHLLGHDHGAPGPRKRMWSLQARVLKHLGAAIGGPTDGAR